MGEGVHEHVDLPYLDTTLLARFISTLVTRLIDQAIVPRVYFKPLQTNLEREIQVVGKSRALCTTPLTDR